MHFITAAPILLLAGTALAAPLNDLERKQFQGAHVQIVTDIDVVTVVQTVSEAAGARPTGGWGGHGHGRPQSSQASDFAAGFSMPTGGHGGAKPTATPTAGFATPSGNEGSDDSSATPTPSTGGRGGKGGQSTPTPAGGKPVKSSTPSSPASSQPTGSTGGSSSSDDDTSSINKYRAMMNKGLKNLSYDTKLEGNVKDTLAAAPGQMVHKLNPGTMGQVLAGGDCSDFTSALVQGWICEIPSLLPSGTCGKGGYVSNGQTGHAEILSSSTYTKVACACADKIWGCDFA